MMYKNSTRGSCWGSSGGGGSSDGEEERKLGFAQFRSQDQRLLCPDTPSQTQTSLREPARIPDPFPSPRSLSPVLGNKEFQGKKNSRVKATFEKDRHFKEQETKPLAGVAELIDQTEQEFQVSINKYPQGYEEGHRDKRQVYKVTECSSRLLSVKNVTIEIT